MASEERQMDAYCTMIEARLAEGDDKLLSVAIKLGTTEARLAEAVALLDSCEATGSEEWERRAAALVAECGPNARVTVSADGSTT